MILVIANHLRHGLFADSDAPDSDGLANTQIAIHHDRGAIVTDVNRLSLAEKIITAFAGCRNSNAQIQKDSFTAPQILIQAREGGTQRGGPPESLLKSFSNDTATEKGVDRDCAAINSDNVRSRFVTGAEPSELEASNLKRLLVVSNRAKNGFQLQRKDGFSGEQYYRDLGRRDPEQDGDGPSDGLDFLCLTFAFFSPKLPVENMRTVEAPMPLTKRQKEVLDYLVAFETKHGYAPSFEEIGKGMKLTSLATVHKHITTLEKKGFIRRGYNQSRSIEIVQLPKPVKEQVIERKVQELPLVGRIAAGRPLEAIEERETLSLGDFARGGNSYVLQVKGNSMIEDHIMDGDFVVCEQTQVANAGDIVVALVSGEEATLKRFYRDTPGKVRLQPANSEMAPIIVAANDVKIQGRVIGVLRKY